MAVVTTPSNLDRWQCLFDPIAETISLRGLGTARTSANGDDGSGTNTTTFTSAGSTFTTDVAVGDVLTIIADPSDDGLIIGHYRVIGSIAATTFEVDRVIPTSSAADLSFKVNAPQVPGIVGEQVADGVIMQVIFSFAKEEWITFGAIGNSVDLNAFDFPIVTISSAAGQYILGGVNGDAASAWSFADDNAVEATDIEGVPRELVRDGGWQEKSAANVVTSEYANYTTLGSLDTDAQAYYQQGDADGDPADYKLTGPVNQAVLTFGPDVPPADTTNLNIATTTITRTAGDWVAENYRVGDYITIRDAGNVANDGSFGPITTITTTVLTMASAPFTVDATDTTATVQVDHRLYTALRVRKKGRYYAIALHVDGGVPVAGILPLINKFPLSHANDPATNIADNGLDDGKISGGDATAVGDIFQEVETHTAAADGAIPAAVAADGTFTFTSAGGGFETLARTIIALRAGDSVAITSGTYVGVYEIQAVTSDTVLNLYEEPGRTYPGIETSLSFTCRTGVLDTGHASNGVLADVDGLTGTLASATSTFDADTAIGDRIVTTGDIVELISGTGAHVGYYKVVSRTNATTLVLNTSDQIFTAQSDWGYRIWRPGMFLQRFEDTATLQAATSMNIADANPDTITRSTGSFLTDGFLDGMAITVVDAEDAGNIGTFIVNTVGATLLTFVAAEALTLNAADTTMSTAGNMTGDGGIVRTINAVAYPFHWRIFANAGDLSQVYQFLQHLLRREYDIDGATAIARGDITDSLMTFISPNGTMLDSFPDDLATGDLNNVTYQDVSETNRNNAFLVGITFAVNVNLTGATNERLTAYFTTNPGGNFGSNSSIIVDDSANVDMNFTAIAGNIQTTFDYTNNAQGGRTPDTDAGITVVAVGDDGAPHVLVTDTITKVNAKTITVSSLAELNYIP